MKCLPNIGQIPDQEQRIWEMLPYQSSVIAALQHKLVSNEEIRDMGHRPPDQGNFFSEPKLLHLPIHRKVLLLLSRFSRVRLFATPWTAARQASLSITDSQGLLKLMSIESVMPSNHLILCRPLLPLPSIFPSIRVFSSGSVLCFRWPKYWSFSFSISPSNNFQGGVGLDKEYY